MNFLTDDRMNEFRLEEAIDNFMRDLRICGVDISQTQYPQMPWINMDWSKYMHGPLTKEGTWHRSLRQKRSLRREPEQEHPLFQTDLEGYKRMDLNMKSDYGMRVKFSQNEVGVILKKPKNNVLCPKNGVPNLNVRCTGTTCVECWKTLGLYMRQGGPLKTTGVGESKVTVQGFYDRPASKNVFNNGTKYYATSKGAPKIHINSTMLKGVGDLPVEDPSGSGEGSNRYVSGKKISNKTLIEKFGYENRTSQKIIQQRSDNGEDMTNYGSDF
jgi:hypothetical protein